MIIIFLDSGGNYKHIDWRSTARRQKLTVRDFQASQSQRIIFLVDCGRMMTGESSGSTLLDHSFNAMLMLSYIALRQGDSVGMITFSNRVHDFTPPKAGVKHINRLLHASCDRHAEFVESRYDNAFLYLRKHCPKRSLVVLLTNVIDEINSHQIHQYMSSLTGRHLPLAVLLRDHEVYNALHDYEKLRDGKVMTASKNTTDKGRLIDTIGDALFAKTDSSGTALAESIHEANAAIQVLDWRKQVIQDLKHRGVLTLDLFPEDLTASLVNKYLDIKARHLL